MQEQAAAVGDPPRSINAADWSRSSGHDQAQLRAPVQSLLSIGGQRPVDDLGLLLHEGDLPAQIALTLDNLTAVVVAAGMAFTDLVHLRVHTTDIAGYLDAQFVVTEHLAAHGANTPVTVVEVACLAIPGMEIEIDGLAVRADTPTKKTPHDGSWHPVPRPSREDQAHATFPPPIIRPPPATTSALAPHRGGAGRGQSRGCSLRRRR